MKLLVQDFLKSAKLHQLDTETGEVSPAPLQGSAQQTGEQAKGYFAALGRTPVVFYAHRGDFHLRAGEDVQSLSGATVEVTGEGLRTLRILKNGEVVLRVAYANPVNPPMELDLSMAEEEDFDLGLFVKNVVGSPKRRERMLAKWS